MCIYLLFFWRPRWSLWGSFFCRYDPHFSQNPGIIPGKIYDDGSTHFMAILAYGVSTKLKYSHWQNFCRYAAGALTVRITWHWALGNGHVMVAVKKNCRHVCSAQFLFCVLLNVHVTLNVHLLKKYLQFCYTFRMFYDTFLGESWGEKKTLNFTKYSIYCTYYIGSGGVGLLYAWLPVQALRPYRYYKKGGGGGDMVQ